MFSRTMLCTACRASIMFFFFQGEDGIRNKGMWLEFRRVLFRSDSAKGYLAWWTTPRQITFGTVRSGDAPDIRTISGKFVREVHAKGAVRKGRGDGVLKVVDAVAFVFTTVAIVDPCVRVLMHE